MQMHATILYMLHAHTTPHSLQLIVTSFFVFSTWVCNKMRARAIDWRWYGRNWCSFKWWERGREIGNGLFIIRLLYKKKRLIPNAIRKLKSTMCCLNWTNTPCFEGLWIYYVLPRMTNRERWIMETYTTAHRVKGRACVYQRQWTDWATRQYRWLRRFIRQLKLQNCGIMMCHSCWCHRKWWFVFIMGMDGSIFALVLVKKEIVHDVCDRITCQCICFFIKTEKYEY